MITAVVILLALALIFGFYMAWSIGANDVANAMGTSVGSGALTLKMAIVLAAIFEFSGAFIVGSSVSETVRSGIFDPVALEAVHVQQAVGSADPISNDQLRQLYELAETDDQLRQQVEAGRHQAAMTLASGMIAALLAAGLWLQIASYFGWPVSTTHSIVGAVVGVGAVMLGINGIDWFKVAKIGSSWVVSPLLAGAISYLMFRLLLRQVFYKPNPIEAARKIMPSLVFIVLFVLMGVTGFKALSPFWRRFEFGGETLRAEHPLPMLITFLTAALIGLVGYFVARRLAARIDSEMPEESQRYQSVYVARSLDKIVKHMRRIKRNAQGEVKEEAERLLAQIEKLSQKADAQSDPAVTRSATRKVERIFVYLQILSACFVAFSHGSNDVANAIGPLSAAWEALQTSTVSLRATTPWYFLALGGVGIVIGLATWGWRVMETIGRRITELTPSRGFTAEFGAAFTILLASLAGIPISTTHTLVGAVLGVGMARGIGAINLNTVRDIVASWIITIPAGAGLAILAFYTLVMLFL